MPRKTKYNDDFPLFVEQWAREGCTDEQIYKKLGISHDAFYKYLDRYDEFAEALKRGRKPVDFEVENALLKRAMGYDYEEVHQEIYIDSNGKETRKIRKIKKHYPPDVTAAIFWIVNRASHRWRSINKDGDNAGNFDERLAEIAAALRESHKNSK